MTGRTKFKAVPIIDPNIFKKLANPGIVNAIKPIKTLMATLNISLLNLEYFSYGLMYYFNPPIFSIN